MKRFTILKTVRYLLNRNRKPEAGFNLVEVATVVIIAGILAAIVAPSWLSFTNRQKLRAAQSNVFRAMQSAQTRAKGNRETWQVSFLETEPAQWAIHSASVNVDNLTSGGDISGGIAENTWYSLEEKIEIDGDNSNFEEITANGENGYRILFNDRGCSVTEIAQECTKSGFINDTSNRSLPAIVIFTHTQLDDTQRCVRIDTILGGMRMADDDACTLQ
jgi:prepilin-type N-terminal cleavage/methylation domain-containing protein